MVLLGWDLDTAALLNHSPKMGLSKYSENRVADAIGMVVELPGAVVAGGYYGLETFYPTGANGFVKAVSKSDVDFIVQCQCAPSMGMQ